MPPACTWRTSFGCAQSRNEKELHDPLANALLSAGPVPPGEYQLPRGPQAHARSRPEVHGRCRSQQDADPPRLPQAVRSLDLSQGTGGAGWQPAAGWQRRKSAGNQPARRIAIRAAQDFRKVSRAAAEARNPVLRAVVAFAGLHDQALLLRRQADPVVAPRPPRCDPANSPGCTDDAGPRRSRRTPWPACCFLETSKKRPPVSREICSQHLSSRRHTACPDRAPCRSRRRTSPDPRTEWSTPAYRLAARLRRAVESETLLPVSTPSLSRISALRPLCLRISSSDASRTAS